MRFLREVKKYINKFLIVINNFIHRFSTIEKTIEMLKNLIEVQEDDLKSLKIMVQKFIKKYVK